MALPQTPEQNKAALEAMQNARSQFAKVNNQMTANSVIGQMLAARGFSQLANQGAPYGGYRQAPSTLPGYSTNTPNYGPGGPYIQAIAQFAHAYSIRAVAASPPEPIEDAGIRPGEVRAYRCWRVQMGFLTSVSMSSIWAPGEPMEGQIGRDGHGAGVHAWKSLSKALTYAMPYAQMSDYGGGTMVMGRVDLWGDIVEHEHGYRSEFAAIVSLDSFLGADENAKQTLETLRERYGI